MHRVRMAVVENRLVSQTLSEHDYVAAVERTGRGWVMEVQDHVVAFAIGNRQNGSVWALFVDPDHQRKGYGRRLHDCMIDWLWTEGHKRLFLTTERGTRAERFYRAAGWTSVGPDAEGGEVRLELARTADPEQRHRLF